jgi:hypothetical protein
MKLMHIFGSAFSNSFSHPIPFFKVPVSILPEKRKEKKGRRPGQG